VTRESPGNGKYTFQGKAGIKSSIPGNSRDIFYLINQKKYKIQESLKYEI
jgi:hypothetical protein